MLTQFAGQSRPDQSLGILEPGTIAGRCKINIRRIRVSLRGYHNPRVWVVASPVLTGGDESPSRILHCRRGASRSPGSLQLVVGGRCSLSTHPEETIHPLRLLRHGGYPIALGGTTPRVMWILEGPEVGPLPLKCCATRPARATSGSADAAPFPVGPARQESEVCSKDREESLIGSRGVGGPLKARAAVRQHTRGASGRNSA